MSWNNTPPSIGDDINKHAWIVQFWDGIQERNWGAGAWAWPRANWTWTQGFVTSLTDNGDNTWTVTDSAATNPVNRYYGYSDPSNPWIPAFYDLIIDDPLDATQCLHTSILGNTATTFHITGQQIADAITSKFLASTTSLVGRRYFVIKRFGNWWSERYLVWPNQTEAWVGLNLQAGAIINVTLTSSGTTATATAKNHGFLGGDSVTIAGAVSNSSHYNGTFTISGITTDTFKYTISAADSSPASGNPTATCPYNGAADPSADFPTKLKDGYELMVESSVGALVRIPITGIDHHNIFFARQTYTTAGQYAIVSAGNKWRFYNPPYPMSIAATTDNNPYAGPPFRWYHSAFDDYLSHAADDTLQATRIPASVVHLEVPAGGGGCEDGTLPAFDQDVQTDVDYVCTPDKNLTPDFFRSLHALQVDLENVCGNYVKYQSYEGAAAIPVFTAATWYEAAGINAFRTSTTTIGTDGYGHAGINISAITLPAAAALKLSYTHSIPVVFAVLDQYGVCQHSGNGNLTSSSFLTGTFVACGSPSSSSAGTGIGCNGVPTWCDEGKTIVISLGFTRNFPNEFMYMWDKTAFIPQVNDVPAFVDPPSLSYPGVWATRKKSIKYKESDGSIGIMRDANGWYPFQNGDFVRWTGDNFNDNTIHTGISGTTLTNDSEFNTTSAPVPDPSSYFDNFYEGKYGPLLNAAEVQAKSGYATGGDAYSLQDTTQNWWPNGVMRTETGTADGSGGTTSLGDSSKAGNAFWDATTGRWVGFTLEMEISGTWYRRPITSMSGTTLSWSDPLPISCSGCTYQLREPKYVLNRWKERVVEVTFEDLSVHTIPILCSDDQNLYFAKQDFAIKAGMLYRIVEPEPGGVWKWDATTSKWVVPTGIDARTGGKWLADQNADLPTSRTDYGKLMKGDYITPGLFTELYNGINALVWVKTPIGWTGRSDPATCERNYQEPPGYSGPDITDGAVCSGGSGGGGGSGTSSCLHGWTDSGGAYHPGADSYWTQDLYTNPTDCSGFGLTGSPDGIPDYLYEDDDAAPQAYALADNGSSCCFACLYNRRYAYGTITGPIIPYQQCGVDWYAYADVDGGCQGPACSGPVGPDCIGGVDQQYIFDDEGDGVLFQKWHKWTTSSPSNSETRQSAKLGSVALPANAPTPTQCGGVPCCPGNYNNNCNDPAWCGFCANWKGYIVTDQCAILTWDNPAGFRKYLY